MQELDLTWGRTFAIWWLLTWRIALVSTLIGFLLGAVVGLVGVMAGVSPPLVRLVSAGLGLCVGIVWPIFVVRMAVAKRYRGFRIALIPPN
jgi:multisubunit Na+/H+ antiporter MnhE subunit